MSARGLSTVIVTGIAAQESTGTPVELTFVAVSANSDLILNL